jgi:hypothetical protein
LRAAIVRWRFDGDAVAGEIEPQQPLSEVFTVRGNELPFPRGFESEPLEILAGAATRQRHVLDIALAVDSYADREFDVATDCLECTGCNFRCFLVKHEGGAHCRLDFRGARRGGRVVSRR